MVADIFYHLFTLIITILVCFIQKNLFRVFEPTPSPRHWVPSLKPPAAIVFGLAKIWCAHIFFSIIPCLWTSKINILKKWKKKTICRYYRFKNVYHKWHSYDVWFPGYGVRLTEFYVIFDRFFSYPTKNQKNNILKKMKKKTWKYYHFTQVHHK